MTTTFWKPNKRINYVPLKRELLDKKGRRMKYIQRAERVEKASAVGNCGWC